MLWNASTPDFPGKWLYSLVHQNHIHVKISNVSPCQKMSLLHLSQCFSPLACRKVSKETFWLYPNPNLPHLYFCPSIQGDEAELENVHKATF